MMYSGGNDKKWPVFSELFAIAPLLLPTHRYKKHCAEGIDLAYSRAYLKGQAGQFPFCRNLMADWIAGEGK